LFACGGGGGAALPSEIGTLPPSVADVFGSLAVGPALGADGGARFGGFNPYSSLVLGDTSELISLDDRIVGPDLCESFIPSLIPPLLIFDLGNSELFVRRFRKSVLSGPAVESDASACDNVLSPLDTESVRWSVIVYKRAMYIYLRKTEQYAIIIIILDQLLQSKLTLAEGRITIYGKSS
jgi:hypothetical protein